MAHLEKFSLHVSSASFANCNPSPSSPVFAILVSVWFIITSLVFFYLNKLYFMVSFALKVILHIGKNDLIYRDIHEDITLGSLIIKTFYG